MATTIILHPPSPPPSSSPQRGSIAPNPNSFKETLKLCTTAHHTKQIHAKLTRTHRAHLPSPAADLIAAYSKLSTPGSLHYALLLFRHVDLRAHLSPSLVLFLLNTLIRAAASVSIDVALSIYSSIPDRRLVPDRFTFPPLLAAAASLSRTSLGLQLHSPIVKLGLSAACTFLDNSLIHFYSETGDLVSARKVFDEMPQRNVVSWTSLIDGYANGDDPAEAVSLFFNMLEEEEERVEPNSVTVACVLSACARLRDVALGERIGDYIARAGIGLNVHLVNTLVDMYMKCGAVDKAERLFREHCGGDVVLWNTMVTNYVRMGLANAGLALFNEMLCSGTRPDRVTVVGVISALAQLGELEFGKRVHGYVLRNGLDGCDSVSNAVIDMYMKCGDPDSAFDVFSSMANRTEVTWNTIIIGCSRNGDLELARWCFEVMPNRDLFSWNTMIGALVKESCFKEAISLFREMQGLGLKTDGATMVSICSACAYLGTLDLAKWVYTYIHKNKVQCYVKLGTALVDMFAKCGDPESAMKIFDTMPVRDVSAWTAAIGVTAAEGCGQKALELFDRMRRDGVEPDSVVFVAVLTALSHGGLVEEGVRFFQTMTETYGFEPQIVHYGCMVDLFGRAGMLTEARTLVEAMPMEPNDVIWGSLLAASRVHRNLEMAQYAADKVLELSPEKSGIHVLLSNAYASAGKWDDVARVRMALKEAGIERLPGSSSIEVDGVIHEFTSTCESHPQMALIAEMVDEMSRRLPDSGYIPDLDHVLINVVDDGEKEFLLSRHSERMAVAFGLISTGQGTPIRIVKNLRICNDCHEFVKIISAVYGREITIRDRNRFHHFQEGVCSCMDYW